MRHRDTEESAKPEQRLKHEDTKSRSTDRTSGTASRLRAFVVHAFVLFLCFPCLCVTLVLMIGCDRRAAATAERAAKAVLVVSGDTASWLTPCGCTSNQSGGLLRRATYLKGLASDGSTAVLYADAGGAPGGTSEYQRVKFEAILRGELA